MHVNLHSSGQLYSDTQNLSSRSNNSTESNSQQPKQAQEQLLDSLAKHVPGVSATEFKALDAKEFTPEKVTGRIAGFVAQGLEQARRDGKSEAEIASLHEQALAGIEQGFNEARDILADMNLLTQDIAATIDETYDQTLDAVRALAPSNPQESRLTYTGLSAAERYQKAEAFSLDLRTQDGDKITVSFAQQNAYESSLGAYSGEDGQAAVFNIDRSAQSQYRFSIEGELDADEMDAIQDLIKDVSLIADDFFSGDVQSAFQQASEFQMDTSELASMHLRLTRSEQYSAASAYQQVQNLPANAQGQAQQAPGRALGHLVGDIQNRGQNPALAFLEEPLDLNQQLLDNLVKQDVRYQQADAEQQRFYEQGLAQLQSLLGYFTDAEAGNDTAAAELADGTTSNTNPIEG